MQQPTTQQALLEDLFPPTHSTFIHCEDDLLLFPSPSYSSIFTNSSSFLQPTFQSLYQSIYSLDTSFTDSISSSLYDQQTVPDQQEFKTLITAEEDEDDDYIHKIHENQKNVVSDDQIPTVFSMGSWNGEKKSKSKRVEGQPSKNLMAERRRRKRLNDRLSMLRSIVPKISKMDRTSILGDTIDYMKELLGKIHDLKEEEIDGSKLVGSFKGFTVNEVQVRSPPKFDVERRNTDTRIEICCSAKPGLMLSTMTTLEALGLDVQHCVISCFNDFFLQASCSEGLEHEPMMSCEDMKQILFKNAGYGGRCM
ncbi:transcription factor bHLH93-like [Cynara cardunculus var. scolymus]|uniref:transcription factor bHLH93-like n=1 Tax=Cynara cardunculus var. scolymus TaxID=59895 RepID=UPI000D6261C0|nr:transcription factor bHLH93-like [Cynara cardunculus var. scolymus]